MGIFVTVSFTIICSLLQSCTKRSYYQFGLFDLSLNQLFSSKNVRAHAIEFVKGRIKQQKY